MLNGTQEVLIDIPGYEKLYQVSNLGYVTNGRKQLKTYRINSGYEALKLQKEGVVKSFLLHRLVAEAFCPNPEGKPEVNHDDGNKANCAALNLEWVTSAENKQHAIATGLKVYNIPTKGLKIGRHSRYHNVTWDRTRGKWVAAVRHNKTNYGTKRFDTEDAAALHVNEILDGLGLQDRPRNIVNLKA